MERRKLGHDPHRHGRFIIIVEQRENSLYKADKEDALGYIPKISYSVPDTMIFITISSVLEENKIRQSLKNLHLELDRIGRNGHGKKDESIKSEIAIDVT